MPRPRKKTSETPDAAKVHKTTTSLDVDLLRKAKHIANHRGKELFEYLDGVLRRTIEADYEQFKKDIL